MVRVVLFERANRSLFSWLIFVVSGSRWTHSALEINGKVYDAAESVGFVSERPPLNLWGQRKIRVYDIIGVNDNHAELWAKQRLGRKYDYVGIFGWLWSVHNQRKFYCFEFVWRYLAAVDIVQPATSSIGAIDIITALGSFSYEGPAQQFIKGQR